MEFLWDILGDIPSGFPPFKLPAFSFQNGDKTYSFTEICRNLGSSLYITPLVAVLESIAIAKSLGNNNKCEKCSFFKNQFLGLDTAAKGKRIDASQEMIAIGTSNILGSFASSYPITGSFSRTAVNAASGVRTPFNGIYTGKIQILPIQLWI
jgi:sodium-independent sulfate anion transporter 11